MTPFMHRYQRKKGFSVLAAPAIARISHLIAECLLSKSYRFVDSSVAGAMCPKAFCGASI
ncbi:hypothetical protein CEV31_0729 [Brucella thiophenivorans]|uniref:Uncharacterized protein n=1 Tax=Brucella thiophenivorans TaxID=571255 RepID=A0A256G257_9HYPH|nr:hypothetical protein CEV31_0729 [Brucella thiophenivorans]